jgi:hypothetical protein
VTVIFHNYFKFLVGLAIISLIIINFAMITSPVETPFLTKSFQLHDICNYVSIEFLKFLNKITAIYQLS